MLYKYWCKLSEDDPQDRAETCRSYRVVNVKNSRRPSWFGHVQGMSDTRTVKKIFNWKPLTKRTQGRPKYRWEDNIKKDICQMKIKNWIACVRDRGKWKEVVEKAKTFNLSTKGSSASGRRRRRRRRRRRKRRRRRRRRRRIFKTLYCGIVHLLVYFWKFYLYCCSA